ncbi:MAG: hypothetical protein M1838_004361 [Thelocarpon superellum]|nr:MAG: hypothetical protein M1838_004361 [Thelocarpon superellum]
MLPLWKISALVLVTVHARLGVAGAIAAHPPHPEAVKVEARDVALPQSNILRVRQAPPVSGQALNQTGWTIAADSFEWPWIPYNLIDGDPTTYWHTEWVPDLALLPHNVTIDMQTTENVNGIAYLPRQDGASNPLGGSNGNIGQHQIFLSTDCTDFGSPVAFGTYIDNNMTKYTTFETQPARCVRLVALSEAGNRGPWSSGAEINVFAAASYTPPASGLGMWGPTIDFPVIPVSATIEPETSRVVVWSASAPDSEPSPYGVTCTATYDPSTDTVTQMVVSNTNHDMFCEGLSVDFNGIVIATGGSNDAATSLLDQNANTWTSGPQLQIPRGYQSSATCSDGRTFLIGGSWSGALGGKNGEIFDPSTNTWTVLPGCDVTPMLTNDSAGIYRADNHAWLFAWKSGSVFQAGPSAAMNWYDTSGTGSYTAAGPRAGDGDAMAGVAVMYDAVQGKILAAGGSPSYSGSEATAAAHLIQIDTPGGDVSVTTLESMSYSRIFANGVALPNGQVFITGGQTIGAPFVDSNVDFTPELWDPTSQTFTPMQANSIARDYHSVALLMPDATVFSGGGGLCGAECAYNHFDAQIFTPPYLIASDGSPAPRPVIQSLSAATVPVGGSVTITTDSPVTELSLIRYAATTHTVNTDQRRIPLDFQTVGTNTLTFQVPDDPGIAIPGYWMLFALNSAGVPSVSQMVSGESLASCMKKMTMALVWRVFKEIGLVTLDTTPKNVRLLMLQRFVRMLAYSVSTLILALYLVALGVSKTQISLFMTLTLIRDIFISCILTLTTNQLGHQHVLALGAVLVSCSGVVLATVGNYWILLAVAVLGVISPL